METCKSAEAGDAKAQYNLGVAYATGQGVRQDNRTAVEWYRKAADQGDATAQ
ncbi:SEL1-like repeat protein, partial [Klebsiella pneumoniae]|uniref:tetratricopeptide repeat protein n=1 Tax=Klebsiella pneumoniae TaxID=573 RepID=UPI002380D4BA